MQSALTGKVVFITGGGRGLGEIMAKALAREGMIFANIDEVQHALDAGEVHLHAKITARIKQVDEEGNEVMKRYDTTPGRIRLGALLPLNGPLAWTTLCLWAPLAT